MGAKGRLTLLAGIVLAGSGCSTGTGFVDDALSSAASSMGSRVGDAAGKAMVHHYSPMFMRWQTAYLMQMAFSAQGYSIANAARDYEPGQYTEWMVSGGDDEDTVSQMRRAYLFNDKKGNQWWQVVYDQVDGDDQVVLEALFTPDRDQMLRLRAEFPDGEGPREIPVEEQNYHPPQRLTKESIEGATLGKESVSVPAGHFQARKVRFGEPGGGTQTWWLSDEVPGGVVKYAWDAPRGEEAPDKAEDMPTDAYVVELQGYGSDARSRLGVSP